MKIVTITISDDYWDTLQETAARLGVTTDELIRVGLEELLHRPDDAFMRTIDDILDANDALYTRLP
jgi:hypothetical protein